MDRRTPIVELLALAGTVCAWIPRCAPAPQVNPANEFDLEPDPKGGIVRLGYGWAWNGPKELEGPAPEPPPEMQKAMDDLARRRAVAAARAMGREQPSEEELAAAVKCERIQWRRRMELPRQYYRNHAMPDYSRILAAVTGGATVTGALYALLPLRTDRNSKAAKGGSKGNGGSPG